MTAAAPSRPAAPSAPARTGSLTGTGALARAILRRDRVWLVMWVAGVVAFITASAASVSEVFPTAEELQDRGRFVQSPVLALFTGPGYGADGYTAGALVANEYLIYCLVAVALMSAFSVVRSTRAEEESGRAELIRAAVVGARAMPAAGLLVALGANLVLGAATAVALTVAVADLPAVGSWAFGAAMAATGAVFAAVALVAAQLAEHARGARAIAVATIVGTLALRGIGDMGEDRALSWLSPFGWAQSTRTYVDERWWPLLISAAVAAALVGAAAVLAARRDVGAGLVRPRPGRAEAAPSLARTSGLALRLQRGSLLGWMAGLAVLAAAFGALVGEVEVFLSDNPQLQDVFGADDGPIADAYVATVVVLLALLATAAGLTAALSLQREEAAGRAEALLATAVGRSRWAVGYLAVALGGATAAMLVATGAMAVTAAVERGEASWLAEVGAAGASRLPAVWVCVALVATLHGLASRAAPWAWVLLVHAAVVGLMADALDLPRPVQALSPFHHLPDLPGSTVAVVPLVVLAALAMALVGLGLGAFRRRDLATT